MLRSFVCIFICIVKKLFICFIQSVELLLHHPFDVYYYATCCFAVVAAAIFVSLHSIILIYNGVEHSSFCMQI